jgi:hypothetical protein
MVIAKLFEPMDRIKDNRTGSFRDQSGALEAIGIFYPKMQNSIYF